MSDPGAATTPYTEGMADQPEDVEAAERQRIRAHYRAELARVAAIPAATRDAQLRIVREVAAARRRNAA